MNAILTLFSLFGYSLLFYIYIKRRVSIAIFFSINFIITVGFIFGIVGILKYGTYIIFSLGICLFIFLCYQYKKIIIPFFTSVPFILFFTLSIVFLFFMEDAQLFFWDEYSHWGVFIKEMYNFGHFYDASSVAAHLRYPPGISIWDYFIVLPTGFTEGKLYFAYFLILFSSSLMMYENLSWKQFHWIILIFVIQMALFATYGHWFTSIYVDHIVSALFFGMIFSFLISKYTEKELWCFVFPLVAITLVKEIGLFFALSFAVFAILFSWHKQFLVLHQIIKSFIRIKKVIVVMLISIIFSILSLSIWNFHQDMEHVPSGKQTLSTVIGEIFSKKKILDEKIQNEVKKRFWIVLKNQQLHKEEISLHYNEFSYATMPAYHKTLKLTTLGSLLFIFLALCIAIGTLQDKNEKINVTIIMGYLAIITVFYLGILYVSYCIAFGSGALRIPSYVRYANTVMLPLLMCTLFFFTPAFSTKRRSLFQFNSSLFAMILVFTVFVFITKPYIRPLYTQLHNNFRIKLNQIVPFLNMKMQPNSKVLVYFPILNNGSLDIILKYMFIPNKATILKNMNDLNQQKLETLYKKYDYIWFAIIDKNMIQVNHNFLKLKRPHKIFSFYHIIHKNADVRMEAIF
jgi:hypothetical protein